MLFDFNEWFGTVRMNYGETLTDNMIVDSVQQASDFFNIVSPMKITEADSTCVFLNKTITPMDDILGVNREQLYKMGITEQQGLDLVMTHECAHRALQGMKHLDFTPQQEELCCDFMVGVRAGLNKIDMSQFEEALAKTTAGKTHPSGEDRVDALRSGESFAKEYYNLHNKCVPTFNDCLNHFNNEFNLSSFTPFVKQVNLRVEDSNTYNLNEGGETCGRIGFSEYENIAHMDGGTESAGGIGFSEYENIAHMDGGTESVGFVDNVCDESELSFKGYTQEEINRKMEHAKKEQRYYEGQVRHHISMADHASTTSNAKYHLHEAEIYQKRANEFKDEYIKWKYTKPTN